ncbi:unnamed protein product [Prunus armeniaca]
MREHMELFQDRAVIGYHAKIATSCGCIVHRCFVVVMSLGSPRKAKWPQGCGSREALRWTHDLGRGTARRMALAHRRLCCHGGLASSTHASNHGCLESFG